MEDKRPACVEQIPQEDWGKTPASVKKLVEEMAQHIEQQEKRLAEVLAVQEQLLEKSNRTSKNSSSPPGQTHLNSPENIHSVFDFTQRYM